MYHTFIVIGQSGCGKGTQAAEIIKRLEAKDGKEKIYRLETGKRFREFIEEPHYSNRLSRELYDAGNLQPEFLAVWMWSDHMLRYLEKDQHIVMDGCPRRFHEAPVLDSALRFYGRVKPNVIYLKVSDTWAAEKLKVRHRVDDSSELVKSRLAWFHTDVEPAINWYKANPDYNFIELNGEDSIENVTKELFSRLPPL